MYNDAASIPLLHTSTTKYCFIVLPFPWFLLGSYVHDSVGFTHHCFHFLPTTGKPCFPLSPTCRWNQAGANVQKVDVNFDRVLIRLFADAGIQFWCGCCWGNLWILFFVQEIWHGLQGSGIENQSWNFQQLRYRKTTECCFDRSVGFFCTWILGQNMVPSDWRPAENPECTYCLIILCLETGHSSRGFVSGWKNVSASGRQEQIDWNYGLLNCAGTQQNPRRWECWRNKWHSQHIETTAKNYHVKK